MRNLDLKTIGFALVGCYALPWLLFGSLALPMLPLDFSAFSLQAILFTASLVAFILGAPFSAGYFAARYAKNRPLMHALIVVLLGVALILFASRAAFLIQLVLCLLFTVMGSLGAFVAVRGRLNEA